MGDIEHCWVVLRPDGTPHSARLTPETVDRYLGPRWRAVEMVPADQLQGAVEARDALAEQLGLALGRLEGATMEPWSTADAWAVLNRFGGQ